MTTSDARKRLAGIHKPRTKPAPTFNDLMAEVYRWSPPTAETVVYPPPTPTDQEHDMTDHRAEAEARYNGDAAKHALLAIHDLLDKRLPPLNNSESTESTEPSTEGFTEPDDDPDKADEPCCGGCEDCACGPTRDDALLIESLKVIQLHERSRRVKAEAERDEWREVADQYEDGRDKWQAVANEWRDRYEALREWLPAAVCESLDLTPASLLGESVTAAVRDVLDRDDEREESC